MNSCVCINMTKAPVEFQCAESQIKALFFSKQSHWEWEY